jgi:hypothetical protein
MEAHNEPTAREACAPHGMRWGTRRKVLEISDELQRPASGWRASASDDYGEQRCVLTSE